MLQIIIFSFNRAFQLDTLISSLLEKWECPAYEVYVLYNTSSESFQLGYELLIKKLQPYKNIHFIKEDNKLCDSYSIKDWLHVRNIITYLKYKRTFTPKSNFRTLCLDILLKHPSRFVMFLTDDAMFINKVSLDKEIFDWLKEVPCNRQFSLRFDQSQIGSANVQVNEDSMYWDFYKNKTGTNWGYPFSVDAHIYDKALILSVLKKYIFTSPNTLEGNICAHIRRQRLLGQGRSNLKMSLLSFPINMVQKDVVNEHCGVDCETLNKLFLDGFTMKYPLPQDIKSFQQYPSYIMLEKDGVIKNLIIKKE